MPDEQLVRRVRSGDPAAFEAIFDRYHQPLLGYCRHMLGSQAEAEDALQHVFLAAHRTLTTDERPLKLKSWLYAVAGNRCTSVLRARREHVALDDVREPSTAGLALADEVEHREDLKQVLGDVAGLPDDQRAALVLSELGDLGHDEIASVLGVRTDKVKALVFQARESLIGSRKARDTDCSEIREQLATLRGGALRRTPITRHLAACAGCRAFKEDVRGQRAALGAVLPVAPALALKGQVLAATVGGGSAAAGAAAGLGAAGAGGAGGAGGAAAGGAAAGAGAAASTAATGAGAAAAGAGVAATATAAGSAMTATKLLAALALTGGAVGGGVAIEQRASAPEARTAPASTRSSPGAPGATPAVPASALPGSPAGTGATPAVPARGKATRAGGAAGSPPGAERSAAARAKARERQAAKDRAAGRTPGSGGPAAAGAAPGQAKERERAAAERKAEQGANASPGRTPKKPKPAERAPARAGAAPTERPERTKPERPAKTPQDEAPTTTQPGTTTSTPSSTTATTTSTPTTGRTRPPRPDLPVPPLP